MVVAVTHSNPFFHEKTKVQKSLVAVVQKIRNVAERVFALFRKVWAYVGKLIYFTKQVLKIVVNRCSSCGNNIKPVLVRMKLFSFVTLPLNAESVVKEGIKVGESTKLHDYEGVALSCVSIAMLVGDAIDSAATFTEGVLELSFLPALEWLGRMSLPLGFILSTMGVFTRSYGIYKIQKFCKDFESDPLLKQAYREENHILIEKHLRQKLEKHLGITPEEMKKIEKKSLGKKNPFETQSRLIKRLEMKKEKTLKRVASSKVAEQMIELKQTLDSQSLTSSQMKSALKLASNIRTTSFRNTLCKIVGIATGLITLVALTLFFFTIPAYVPFILLAVAIAIRLALLIYEESCIKRGLLEVTFTPETPASTPEALANVTMQKSA